MIRTCAFGLCCLLLASCGSSDENYIDDIQGVCDTVRLNPTTELLIDPGVAISNKSGVYSHYTDSIEYLIFVDSTLNTVHGYDLWADTSVFSYDMTDATRDLPDRNISLFIHSVDSIYVLGFNRLSLVNANGVVETWNLDTIFPGYPEFIAFGSGTQVPFIVDDNTFIVAPMIQDVDRSSPQGRIDAYSIPAFFGLKLHEGGAFEKVWTEGEYPEYLKSGKMYMENPPICTSLDAEQFIVSHDNSAEIQIVDLHTGKLKGLVNASSCFFEARMQVDNDKIGDIGYAKQHIIESSAYLKVKYNPFTKEIYRINWGSIPYGRTEYEVNSAIDKPWSIVVIDSTLEMVNEYFFLNSHSYDLGSIIPTSRGVLIRNREKFNNKEFRYGLFEIN